MHIQPIHTRHADTPVALVLGTGDIASAIARSLFRIGWGVVMLRDAGVPVLRRGMAFDDALEEGFAQLDGAWAVRAPMPEAIPALARAREAVILAALDLAVFTAQCPGLARVLIDARMRKYAAPADLRPLAPLALGIGPGFMADGNVDIAIETLPGHEGELVVNGATASATGRAVPLGGAGEERFVYAPVAGGWRPAVAIGAVVEAGTLLGTLGGCPVEAPIAGCIRGMVRAVPSGVARGSKLIEIDPRPGASSVGVPPRAARIAAGIQYAVDAMMPVAA